MSSFQGVRIKEFHSIIIIEVSSFQEVGIEGFHCITQNLSLLTSPVIIITVVEDDPNTGIYYVGRGCYPNREGVVQLDAAMMRGSNCSFGAVAGLERYMNL